MQLNLKSNIDTGWETKYIKHNKTFFRQHTRRAEWLALSKQGINPASFQPKRKATSTTESGHNKQYYNEDKPLFLGHLLPFLLGTNIMKINHFSWDTDYLF